MADVNYDNIPSIIGIYEGTVAEFEAITNKSNFYGRLILITGTDADKNQAMWTSEDDGSNAHYLNMSDVATLKAQLAHIDGIAFPKSDGTAGYDKYDLTGGKGFIFKGNNGITVKINPLTSTDIDGKPYWTIEVNGQTLKADLIGTTDNGSDTATHPDTIRGAKAYADSLYVELKGTKDTNDTTAETIRGAKDYADKVKTDLEGTASDTKESATIAGAKEYADDVAASKASAAKDEAIQASKDYVDPLLANKADLENGKIIESQLPDYIFGQMLFGGTITAGGDNIMEVSPSSKLLDKVNKPSTTSSLSINKTDASTYEGAYFIVTGGLTSIFGFSVVVGDWIVSTGNDWRKVDNTDAISSVADLTGVITASALAQKLAATGDANELALKSEVDAKYTKPATGIPKSDLAPEVQTSLDGAVTEVGITPADTDYLTFNVGKGGTARTITYDVKTDNTVGDAINDTTKKGLATVEDVAAYLKARFSVKVVS